jgi:hypothetical protein
VDRGFSPVLARLDTGIVGSNPTGGIDFICMYVYSMFVLSFVGRGLAMS